MDTRVPLNVTKFAHYKKWLTNDDEEDFVSFSQRFAAWADNRKAHYDDARPTIIDICLAAYRNVLTHLGFDPDKQQTPINLATIQQSKWAVAYVRLISVLSNHVKHYENDPPLLQDQLQFLLHTIGIQVRTRPAIPQISSPTGPMQQQPGPSHSTSSNQPPAQTTPVLPPQSPQVAVSQSSQAGPSQPARPTPPLPHKARHPVPKRKRQDLAALIDMDVGRSTTTAAPVAPSIKPEETTNDLHHPSVTPERFRNEFADLQHPSMTPERFRNASAELHPPSVTLERPGDASLQPHHPSQTPEPMMHASVETVPNALRNLSNTPGPILNNTIEASTSTSVSTTGGAHSDDVEFQRLTEQFLVKEDAMEVDPSPADDLPSYQDIQPDKEPLPPPIVFSDAVLPSEPNVLGTYLDPGQSVHIEITLNEEQVKDILAWNERFGQTNMIRHAKCISLCCFQSHDLQKPSESIKPTWPSNPIMSLRTEHLQQPVSISVPITGFIDLSPFLQQGTNRLVVEQKESMPGFGWIVFEHKPTKQQLELLASELLVCRPLAPPAPAVRVLIPEEPIPIKDVALPDQDGWIQSIVVLHYKQCPSIGPHTLSVTFTLSEQQHSDIKRWIQRFAGADEIEKSQCVSLCCYATSDLAQYRGIKIRQFGELKPSWPSDNALKLNCGEIVDLPLAPPMFTNENGFVDLSPFLVEGENKIEISQDRNLSQYAVAIFMHSPTRQQLESVVARRKNDQQWNTFLRDLGKPLVLEPTKCPWLATSA